MAFRLPPQDWEQHQSASQAKSRMDDVDPFTGQSLAFPLLSRLDPNDPFIILNTGKFGRDPYGEHNGNSDQTEKPRRQKFPRVTIFEGQLPADPPTESPVEDLTQPSLVVRHDYYRPRTGRRAWVLTTFGGFMGLLLAVILLLQGMAATQRKALAGDPPTDPFADPVSDPEPFSIADPEPQKEPKPKPKKDEPFAPFPEIPPAEPEPKKAEPKSEPLDPFAAPPMNTEPQPKSVPVDPFAFPPPEKKTPMKKAEPLPEPLLPEIPPAKPEPKKEPAHDPLDPFAIPDAPKKPEPKSEPILPELDPGQPRKEPKPDPLDPFPEPPKEKPKPEYVDPLDNFPLPGEDPPKKAEPKVPLPPAPAPAKLDLTIGELPDPAGFDADVLLVDASLRFSLSPQKVAFGDDGSGFVVIARQPAARGAADFWTRFDPTRVWRKDIPVAATRGYVEGRSEIGFQTMIAAATPTNLQFQVEAPEKLQVGQVGRIRMTIRNHGKTAARNTIFRVDLPPGISHRNGKSLDYFVGNLQPGKSHQAVLVVKAETAGTADTRLGVTTPDSDTQQVTRQINIVSAPQGYRQVVTPMPPRPPLLYPGYLPPCRCW